MRVRMRVRRSIRAKKSPRARRTVLAKRSPRAKKSVREKPEKVAALTPMAVAATAVPPMDEPPTTRPNGVWTFVLVMVFLSAAAMLSATLRSGDVATGPDPAVTEASRSAANLPVRSESLSMATSRPEEPAAQSRPASRRIEPATRVEPSSAQSDTQPREVVAIQPAAIALGHIAPVAVEPAASVVTISTEQKTAAVNVTGCLELDDDTYRLKDASGAPKARSWKTGFLRKKPATIAITDTANRLALSSHVGHLITLTGTLVDREMQAHALQRVASSCDRNG